ncbi:PAC2 family protein [Chloroflexota bacterium]
MNKLVKIYARPKLKSPVMLASWPGIGNVSLILADYLKRKLDFKILCEVDSSYFFDPTGVMVKDSLVEAPHFPENRFYYWKNRGEGNDIILFFGEDQPVAKGYELAHCILDVGVRFHIERIYTCAAALTRIHHTEESRVWGVATSLQAKESLQQYDLVQRGNIHISGLNGLMLGVARERDIDGVCLLGEVPSYATHIQNPMAAQAVLGVLARILGIDIDMAELAQLAGEVRENIKQVAAEAMGEYIDHFTEPIWEQGGGGEYEDDDEDEE